MIRSERDKNGEPTLGVFKPKKIKRLHIVESASEWTEKQKAILSQMPLGFERSPREELEKIPYDFLYEFVCDDPKCKGHKMSCTDWEMAEAYRSWRIKYGDRWEEKFRERFESAMIRDYDTHFFVGTLHQHPKTWIIVGLFYPPKATMDDLFE
jgi:hypothetical protein